MDLWITFVWCSCFSTFIITSGKTEATRNSELSSDDVRRTEGIQSNFATFLAKKTAQPTQLNSEEIDLLLAVRAKLDVLSQLLQQNVKEDKTINKKVPPLPPLKARTNEMLDALSESVQQDEKNQQPEVQHSINVNNQLDEASESLQNQIKRRKSVLSDEDVQLAQELKRKIIAVKEVLEKEEKAIKMINDLKLMTPPIENESSMKNDLPMIDPGDVQSIKKLKNMLQQIKTLQEKQQQEENTDSLNTVSDDNTFKIKEGRFTGFVDDADISSEQDEGTWEDAPVPQQQLGVQDAWCKDGLACNDSSESPDDNAAKDSINVAEEKLLKTIEYAKENGVDVEKLLERLNNRKGQKEESELEKLKSK